MSNTDFELFPGKNLSNLFEDIYNNQQHKKIKISELIAEIKNTIKTPNDIVMIGSILKDLVDTSVRNDESLIKLATIAQRIITATVSADGADMGILSDEEKAQLLKEVKDTVNEIEANQNDKVDELSEEFDDLKTKMKNERTTA